MAFRISKNNSHNFLSILLPNLPNLQEIVRIRSYSKDFKIDWNKLRPMIKKRIENRAGDYPIKSMIPVAKQVLQARSELIKNVSTLLKVFPVFACKCCPEVYIGEKGHQIKTCRGYKSRKINQTHQWINASLNDILVPVETFHLDATFQDIIQHNQRFDFPRIPAVVELCWQAGVHPNELESSSIITTANNLQTLGNTTIREWEKLREGVKKLLLVYPSKVCKHCSEVHVGPSGHKARLCGVLKYHFWEKAGVDDLVPPKIVWHRRPQDPPILLDEGRDFYGHAPAVVDLCSKAGALLPTKYNCMMKFQGITAPSPIKV